MVILFWNICKKDSFFSTIVDIVREEDVDLIAFAEFPDGEEKLFENELQQVEPSFRYLKPYGKNKIEIFYKEGKVSISNAQDGERISVKRIISKINGITYSLIFCHIWSRLYSPARQQNYKIPIVVKEIIDYERQENNKHTVVCGDFNMDTFDDGMLLHNGFNAMMTETIANRKTRKVEKEEFGLFYNPMWSLYGDLHGNEVAGTYYYQTNEPVAQYWHMLDQVIMRPDVIPVFDKQSLKIVAKGVSYNLLNKKGIIDKNNYSDHLPIMFNLNI